MIVTKTILIFLLSVSVWFQIAHIDSQIEKKQAQIEVLSDEIEQAQQQGTAETMDIVEKIGLVRQLEDDIRELELKKKELEEGKGSANIADSFILFEGVNDRGR